MALEQEKCEACKGIEDRLSQEQAQKMLDQVPGWEVIDNTIQREFQFPDFAKAMEFANKISQVAEEQNHHPDLHISWGKVGVELSTHKVGGLSRNDFILAAKINQLGENQQEATSI